MMKFFDIPFLAAIAIAAIVLGLLNNMRVYEEQRVPIPFIYAGE